MDPFIGEIKVFGFGFTPTDYAQCNGQIMVIAQNTALFSILGTNFGGNGTTNFALPNLQGSLAVGQGEGPGLTPWWMGEVRGSETLVLVDGELPAHQHGLSAAVQPGTLDDPSGAELGILAAASGDIVGRIYSSQDPKVPLNSVAMMAAGGDQPHDNMMPFVAVNYCIALNGRYPPRS